jgi:hypothetical protein
MSATALRAAATVQARRALPERLADATEAQKFAYAIWLLARAACPVCAQRFVEEGPECGCPRQAQWTVFRGAAQ